MKIIKYLIHFLGGFDKSDIEYDHNFMTTRKLSDKFMIGEVNRDIIDRFDIERKDIKQKEGNKTIFTYLFNIKLK